MFQDISLFGFHYRIIADHHFNNRWFWRGKWMVSSKLHRLSSSYSNKGKSNIHDNLNSFSFQNHKFLSHFQTHYFIALLVRSSLHLSAVLNDLAFASHASAINFNLFALVINLSMLLLNVPSSVLHLDIYQTFDPNFVDVLPIQLIRRDFRCVFTLYLEQQ